MLVLTTEHFQTRFVAQLNSDPYKDVTVPLKMNPLSQNCHACTHTHMHVCMHAHMHARMHAHTHTHIHVCVYVCVCLYVLRMDKILHFINTLIIIIITTCYYTKSDIPDLAQCHET